MNPTQPQLPLTDPQHAARWEPHQTDHTHWYDGRGGERTITIVVDRRGRL